MKVAFTLCSLNYMHQATTLGQSLLKHNPDYKFVIGLVDRIDDRVDKSKLPNFEIIEVHEVVPKEMLDSMVSRYNIIELNTSVKPFYFEYLFRKLSPEFIIYFDPDIAIYQPLRQIEHSFVERYNLIVTPHANSPRENKELSDLAFIQVGIFNFGFVAMKNCESCHSLVSWWERRLFESGYIATHLGLFVDQLWMNLSVCYSDNALILKDEGYNMAPWNLHERVLSTINDIFYVNDKTLLTFFHFSGITDANNFLKSHEPSITFDDRPDLKELFYRYNLTLNQNHKHYYKTVPCFYKQKKGIKHFFVKILNKVIYRLIKTERILLIKNQHN